MNAMLHPSSYHTLTRCSNCGTEHALTSTREHLSVEICSSCHPFYTGSPVPRLERRADRPLRGTPAPRPAPQRLTSLPPRAAAHVKSGDGGMRVAPRTSGITIATWSM